MRLPHFHALCKVISMSSLLVALGHNAARADWVRDDTSIAWRSGTNVVWKFSFDPNKGKPFFHPLSVAGRPSLALRTLVLLEIYQPCQFHQPCQLLGRGPRHRRGPGQNPLEHPRH